MRHQKSGTDSPFRIQCSYDGFYLPPRSVCRPLSIFAKISTCQLPIPLQHCWVEWLVDMQTASRGCDCPYAFIPLDWVLHLLLPLTLRMQQQHRSTMMAPAAAMTLMWRWARMRFVRMTFTTLPIILLLSMICIFRRAKREGGTMQGVFSPPTPPPPSSLSMLLSPPPSPSPLPQPPSSVITVVFVTATAVNAVFLHDENPSYLMSPINRIGLFKSITYFK